VKIFIRLSDNIEIIKAYSRKISKGFQTMTPEEKEKREIILKKR